MSVTKQNVGLVEALGEVVEEVLRARVPVRLERHDDAAAHRRVRAARGLERGVDLGRVVAVVVDHGDVVERRRRW